MLDEYGDMSQEDAPSPWKRVPVRIAGVTAIGFGPGTELLAVLSHSGVGVFDCRTGQVVARRADDEGLLDDHHDPISVTGIGPLDGQHVPLAGLWGGGLRTTTPDGWVVHRIAPAWPAEGIVLCPPDARELESNPKLATLLIKDHLPPFRGFGFSDSGHTLAVASTNLYIWHRPLLTE